MVLLCFVTLAGCATTSQSTFNVQVDSINLSTVKDRKTYALLPGNKETSPEDLQYKEFSSYVHRALSSIGLTKASDENQANIVIFLAYGIGDPQRQQYAYSIPTWGVTGYSSSTTYGSVTSYGNNAAYSGTTYNTPRYGITGTTSHVGSNTTFLRWIILDAFDVASYLKENKMVPVWKTTVTSTGSSGDLRRVFPVLLAASAQYVGSDTGQKKEMSIYEEDPTVSFVKGIPLQKKEQ